MVFPVPGKVIPEVFVVHGKILFDFSVYHFFEVFCFFGFAVHAKRAVIQSLRVYHVPIFMGKGVLPVHGWLLGQKLVFVWILVPQPKKSFLDILFVLFEQGGIAVGFRIRLVANKIPKRRINGVEGNVASPVGIVTSYGIGDLPQRRLVFTQEFYTFEERLLEFFLDKRGAQPSYHAVSGPCGFVSARKARGVKARGFGAMFEYLNCFFFCLLCHGFSIAKRARRYEIVDSAPWFKFMVCWPNPS